MSEMSKGRAAGTTAREFSGQQFADSNGDVWTVAPCDVMPGEVAIRVDTCEGPVTVSIPHGDVSGLVSRLMMARFAAERRAAGAKVAAGTATTADRMATPEAATANQAGIRAFVETKGSVPEKAAAGMKVWHETYAKTANERRADTFAKGDRVAWIGDSGKEYTGEVSEIGSRTVDAVANDGCEWVFARDRMLRPAPQATPAKPACDGTCGDQCDGGEVDLFANGPDGQVVS